MRNEPLNYFSESQRFRQLWLWIIILAVDGVVIYAVLSEMQHQAIDSSTALLAACGVTVFTVGFLLAFRLDTRISADGIRYRFLPFQWKFKHLGWEEISKAYIRTYKPLREYGGWGIRFGLGDKGMAYNISGNQGLQLELANGKKILFGTQCPNEIEQALLQLNKYSSGDDQANIH